jgi:molybdate transport system substrate-binding protein
VKTLGFVVAALAAGTVAVSSCGNDDGGRPRLTVSAASSLTEALTACSREFPDATVHLEFAGSDELAARIRQGVRPDVYAAANTVLPSELSREGLLEKPRVFATNELVLTSRAGSSEVRSLQDLTRQGVKIAVGSASVPVGSYTLQALSRMEPQVREAIAHNIRSREPDVKGVIGKLTQGAVDAGFVYESDVEATDGRLVSIKLPARLEPTVAYGAGVVKGTDQPVASRAYLQGLLAGSCADALRKAGFGRPESP